MGFRQQYDDEMFPAAVDVILETGHASASMLQRRLKLGYARASRIVDEMEKNGIIGPFHGSKPRDILITKDQWKAMKYGTQKQNKESETQEHLTLHDIDIPRTIISILLKTIVFAVIWYVSFYMLLLIFGPKSGGEIPPLCAIVVFVAPTVIGIWCVSPKFRKAIKNKFLGLGSRHRRQTSDIITADNMQKASPECILSSKRPGFEIDTQIESIETEEELRRFCDSHPLIDDFLTKVKGVTFNNDDGTSRQEILSLCLRGERVGFRHYLFGGKSAYAVVSDHGEIGNLSADLAERMDYCYGSEAYISGTISDITGGDDGLYYGCILHIYVYGPQA